MDVLSERIADLAVKYLMAENRNYDGVIDRKQQAEALISMITCEDIRNIFSFSHKSYSNLNRYELFLESLLENRNESDIDSANRMRSYLFEKIVRDFIERIEDEVHARHEAKETLRLRRQIEELRAQLEFGKPSKDVTLWNRLNSRVNLPYLVILCLAVVLVGGLVVLGFTAKMAVNVDFNVGELIGGLLVGTGAAAAGISYATRNHESGDNGEG